MGLLSLILTGYLQEGMFLPLLLVPDNGRRNISLNPLTCRWDALTSRVAPYLRLFLITTNQGPEIRFSHFNMSLSVERNNCFGDTISYIPTDDF
ncbi:MAG UNVERIFIED_CONTAM: hypothetical protein LVR29_03680 [Microcystis novacekii LVE1205-3]